MEQTYNITETQLRELIMNVNKKIDKIPNKFSLMDSVSATIRHYLITNCK